jgi:hypothetical protein
VIRPPPASFGNNSATVSGAVSGKEAGTKSELGAQSEFGASGVRRTGSGSASFNS